MAVTLNKLKIYKARSETTTCFSAEILWHGKLVGFADNDGRGACTSVCPALGPDESTYPAIKAAFAEAEAWVRTQPDLLGRAVARDPRYAKFRSDSDPDPSALFHTRLDSYVDELVDRDDQIRYARSLYRRAAKSNRLLGLFKDGGEPKVATVANNPAGRAALLRGDEPLILSDFSEDEAANRMYAYLNP